MVKQYPYILFLYSNGSVSNQDDNLDFVAGASNWIRLSKCRDENNTSSNSSVSNVSDGLTYNYQSVIQLPKGCRDLKIGDKVKVLDSNNQLRIEGIVQMFKRDQLHSRAWL